MLKKFKVIFMILPYTAMILATITFVKSLFYDFRNDTVPFFSIFISCTIALLSIMLNIGAGICVVKFIKSNYHSFLIGIVFLLNFVFSAICLFFHYEQLKVVAAYFLITSLLFAMAFLVCRIDSDLS